MEVKTAIIKGRTYINTTGHDITLWEPTWCKWEFEGGCKCDCWPCADFEHAKPVIVPPSGVLINARRIEKDAGRHVSGVELVKVKFEVDLKSIDLLCELEETYPGAIIIGSIIAAQAFPGRVFGLIPCLGYERISGEKIAMAEKFITF